MIKSSVSDGVIDADMNHLLGWLGVKDFQTWARMSIEEQRPYHEQFAKGFETYLAEGQASAAPALTGLFQSFARWLKQIYGDVQKSLGVTPTDDVRGAMARIIADGQSRAHPNDTPEITAARQAIADMGDTRRFEFENDDGTIDSITAAELMARADAEDAFAEQAEQAELANQAAINCFIKWGGL